MSFKKTVTFTAKVSDYSDGTVSARVQAENKILGDLVTFILSHNLGISIQEKVEIGSSKWAGEPFYCSTDGATSDVNNNSLAGDFYFLGRGITKKCLGFGVDNHNIYIGLSDTPTHDLTKPKNETNYARLPCAQLRYLRSDNYRNSRSAYGGAINPIAFSTLADALELTINYWKSDNNLVIFFLNTKLVITKEPYTALYTYTGQGVAHLHYSFDDEFLISDGSYTGAVSNDTYSSNHQLGYAMSYNPFFVRRGDNYAVWEATSTNAPTSILCHRIGITTDPETGAIVPDNENGITANKYIPTISPYLFPRIGNNELYIKKMYVPMTYPAVASPVKIGYTPGKLNAGNVYNLNNKNYVCLNNGILGLFVEVEDQGD